MIQTALAAHSGQAVEKRKHSLVRGANAPHRLAILADVIIRAENFKRAAGRGHAGGADVRTASEKCMSDRTHHRYLALSRGQIEERKTRFAVGAKLLHQATKERTVILAESA